MLPWQHNSLLVNEYNYYTFIACIVEGYMSPHYNVLPGAVCASLLILYLWSVKDQKSQFLLNIL